MKKILTIGVLVAVFAITGSVYAASQEKEVRGSGSSSSVTTKVVSTDATDTTETELQTEIKVQQKLLEGTEEGEKVENQNRVENKGEEKEIKNKEKEGDDEDGDDVEDLEKATQRRSQVANAVQELLKVADRVGGIGQEVRIIAQSQNQNQEKIEKGLEKIKDRSGFAKFLIGLDDKEVKNTKELLTQNKEQIKKLIELKDQLKNKFDQTNLEEQIQVLEQTNSEIEKTLEKTRKGFSLFGWLF